MENVKSEPPIDEPASNVVPFPVDPLIAIELDIRAHADRMKARKAAREAAPAEPELRALTQEGLEEIAILQSDSWIEDGIAYLPRQKAERLEQEARREAAFATPRAFKSIDGGRKSTGSRRPRRRPPSGR